MEQIEVFQIVEAFDYSLSVLHSGVLLLLDLDQEPAEVLGVHEAVLRVAIEHHLDLRRRLRRRDCEPPLEAAADSVGMSRHRQREREIGLWRLTRANVGSVWLIGFFWRQLRSYSGRCLPDS